MRFSPGSNYYSTLENEKSKTKQNKTKRKKTLGNDFKLPVTLHYIILRQQLHEESGNSISRLRVI